MAKEQLGWDDILNGVTEPVQPEGLDSSDDAQPEKEKKPRKSRASSKSKKKDAASAVVEDEVKYSGKDWGKLEFGKTSNVKTDVKAEIPKAVAAVSPVEEDEGVETEDEAEEISLQDEEPRVLSVSELNKYIRDILEGEFPLLWLKGEISNFKAHTSGHFYFSLKDAKAQINAVMFRGFNSQLRFKPEDGMEVLVRGKVTVYEPRGNYQVFCETMEPVGAGALQKAFEQLKSKLQSEGLFDPARKRPIPRLPRHIAIVTSPTGAAIRDILNILGRRFKAVNITLVPCKVQGDQAPAEIVQAIEMANRLADVDVMIVGRGGGSIEDLWAFNDEGVARAIAASKVPIISAVGHEIDFTIADFVADLRAPTPSAAAELVVKDASELMDRIASLKRSLNYLVLRQLNSLREKTLQIGKRLVDPQRRLQDAAMRCDELMQRLEAGMRRLLNDRRLRVELLRNRMGSPLAQIEIEKEVLAGWAARLRTGMLNILLRRRERMELKMAVLDSLSPLKVLDRGYSMVIVDGKIVTHAKDLNVGSNVLVRMCQGSFEAQVTKVDSGKR